MASSARNRPEASLLVSLWHSDVWFCDQSVFYPRNPSTKIQRQLKIEGFTHLVRNAVYFDTFRAQNSKTVRSHYGIKKLCLWPYDHVSSLNSKNRCPRHATIDQLLTFFKTKNCDPVEATKLIRNQIKCVHGFYFLDGIRSCLAFIGSIRPPVTEETIESICTSLQLNSRRLENRKFRNSGSDFRAFRRPECIKIGRKWTVNLVSAHQTAWKRRKSTF